MHRDRLGIFQVPMKHVQLEPEMVSTILKGLDFIPTRVECIWHKGCFDYVGLSSKFKELKEGEKTPKYRIEMNDKHEIEAIEEAESAN